MRNGEFERWKDLGRTIGEARCKLCGEFVAEWHWCHSYEGWNEVRKLKREDQGSFGYESIWRNVKEK